MTQIRENGPRISEDDLCDFEASLGKTLTSDYRNFLLRCNGGRPTPNIVGISDICVNITSSLPAYGIPGPTDVQFFFGIARPIYTSSLEWNLSSLSQRRIQLPCLLPIACDSGGNLFCLILEGNERGNIVYCDLQSVFGRHDQVPALYFVATDFDTFLHSMTTMPE